MAAVDELLDEDFDDDLSDEDELFDEESLVVLLLFEESPEPPSELDEVSDELEPDRESVR